MQQVLLIPIGKLGGDGLPQCTPFLARLHTQKTSMFAASSNHSERHATTTVANTNTSVSGRRIRRQSKKQENSAANRFYLLKDCHLRFPIKSKKELTVFATDNCDVVRNSESLDLCCFSCTDYSYALSHILQPDKIPENWDWLKQVLVSDTMCYSYTQLSSRLSSLAHFAQMLKDSKSVALATLSFAPDAIAMLIPTGTEMTTAYRLVDETRTRRISPTSSVSAADSDYTTVHCFFLQRRLLQHFEPLAANAQQHIPSTTRSYSQLESESDSSHMPAANEESNCELINHQNFQSTLRNRFAQTFGEQHAFMHRHPGGSSRRPRNVAPATTAVTERGFDRHITQKRYTKQRIVELLKEWTMESACKLQTRFESAGTPIISSLIRGDLLKRAKHSFSRVNYEQFLECLNSRGLLSNALRQSIALLQNQRNECEGSAKKDLPPLSDCMRLSNDSDHLADEDNAESVTYSDTPNGSAVQSRDSIHTERVLISNHLVDVLSPNDDGRWMDENVVSKTSLEDAAINGELILNCEDDDGDVHIDDNADTDGYEEPNESLGEADDAVMLTNSTTNAQEKPEQVESETMLALIREARSSRKFQSPNSVPLSVTDERLRDKLAQEAISVALRTRSRVTLQTLFGILRQHCVRIRGRSLMNSMTKLGYRFDRKLRCYVKS